jgi:DNA primase
MSIPEIKENLSLARVLEIYQIKVDKNGMLLCPFHEDKKASLQVNLEKDFYKCHACGTKGDQIQFVQDFEKLSKREALLKCASLIGNVRVQSPQVEKNKAPTNQNEKIIFLEKLYETFVKSTYLSAPAKAYLQTRNLHQLLEKRGQLGFNSGQFHHAGRFENEANPEEAKKEIIAQALEYGLLLDANLTSKTGEKAYQVFGNKSIVFALRNQENQIVSFYFRSIDNQKTAKHFYLKNRSGLYPNYPNPATKKLILTESIIDAASLLQLEEITVNYSILACYGTNGLTEEIQKAILDLKKLEEIIFVFDNDMPGKTAAEKYAEQLSIINCELLITTIELPNKDVNETLQLHDPEIFIELLEQRIPFISKEETLTIEKKQPFKKENPALEQINFLIEKSGIIGEENSRLLLFIIASSYKNPKPLHAIVQGSSGSGKTHLISKIADLMPQEDVLRFTRITESSLYNWGEFDLVGKLLIIEDLDGLKEEAMFAMRELISNQRLSSSVSVKDKKGNIKSAKKEVKGIFSSLSATTKGDLYEDNMSRSFLLAVDESQEQSQKIIQYQNQRYAGQISKNEELKAKQELQQFIRNLQNYEVINPFATQLQLPDTVHKKRRLNEMFQAIIQQITYLNQKDRNLEHGKLITKIQDVEQAVAILFESIILKIDELEGSLRQFYETLLLRFKEQEFTRFEIMEHTGFRKTQLQHYLNQLVSLEYLRQFGHSNKGFKYRIGYVDNMQKTRKQLKDYFKEQLEKIKTEH